MKSLGLFFNMKVSLINTFVPFFTDNYLDSTNEENLSRKQMLNHLKILKLFFQESNRQKQLILISLELRLD